MVTVGDRPNGTLDVPSFHSDETGLMTNTGQTASAELMSAATSPAPAAGCGCSASSRSRIAVLSALVTFVVLAGLTPIAPTHEVVVTLLAVNIVTVVLLLALIGRELWRVLQARRRGRAASRLHVRIVALFSVIAAVPAILVAVFASVTLDRGLDRLFSQQNRTLIENSLTVVGGLCARARRSSRAPRTSRSPSSSSARAPCSTSRASSSTSSSPSRPRSAACPR